MSNNNQRVKQYKKLGGNVLILMIGSFSSKLMSYFLVPFFTSVLTTQEYGIYDLIVTTVNLLFPIFTLLLSEALLRFSLDSDYSSEKVFTVSLLGCGIGFAVGLIFSPLLLLSQALRKYAVFLILYYLAYTLHVFFSQFAKGIGKTLNYSVCGIISTAVSLVLNILLLAVFRVGVVGYLWATILGSLISTVYLFVSCRLWKYFTPVSGADLKLAREMLHYSVPMIPNTLSWWVCTSSDKYFINAYFSAAAMGLYAVAYKVPSLLTMVTSIVLNAWQLSAVEDFGSEKTRRFYTEVYNKFFFLLLTVVSAIITCSKILAKLLFSGDFYEAWVFIPALVAGYMFHDLSAFLGTIYTSSKKTAMLFYSTTLAAVLNLVLNWVLIPYWGPVGAAVTTFISYFVVWLVRAVDSRKYMKIDYSYLEDGACFALLLIQTVSFYLDHKFSFACNIALLAVIIFIKRKTFLDMLELGKDILKRKKS